MLKRVFSLRHILTHYSRQPSNLPRHSQKLGTLGISSQVRSASWKFSTKEIAMDVESKLQEMLLMFAKIESQIYDVTKKNSTLVLEELEKVETAVQGKTQECLKPQLKRLQDVTDEYEERIKMCNERSITALHTLKAAYESKIRKAKSIKELLREVLKECSDNKGGAFSSCLIEKTRTAFQQRSQMATLLSDTVRDARRLTNDQLKEAVKCHSTARRDALDELKKIVQDLKKCT